MELRASRMSFARPPVNLNKDSTHPNPWAPPNAYNFATLAYNPYRIYKGHPTTITKLPNPLRDDPFFSKMVRGAWDGFLIGIGLATTSTLLDPKLVGFRPKMARFVYLAAPYSVMPVTYIATREVMEHFAGDQTWTYFWATAAPATIYGVVRNSFSSGALFLFFGGMIPLIYKMNIDYGGFFHMHNPDRIGPSRFLPLSWKGNSKSKFLESYETEPSWKKWLDKGKTGDGPEE